MLGQGPVGVRFADLVHLAGQLGQKLNPNHAVISGTLDKERERSGESKKKKQFIKNKYPVKKYMLP